MINWHDLNGFHKAWNSGMELMPTPADLLAEAINLCTTYCPQILIYICNMLQMPLRKLPTYIYYISLRTKKIYGQEYSVILVYPNTYAPGYGSGIQTKKITCRSRIGGIRSHATDGRV
jgi:hypothetical protein